MKVSAKTNPFSLIGWVTLLLVCIIPNFQYGRTQESSNTDNDSAFETFLLKSQTGGTFKLVTQGLLDRAGVEADEFFGVVIYGTEHFAYFVENREHEDNNFLTAYRVKSDQTGNIEVKVVAEKRMTEKIRSLISMLLSEQSENNFGEKNSSGFDGYNVTFVEILPGDISIKEYYFPKINGVFRKYLSQLDSEFMEDKSLRDGVQR